MYIGRNIKPLLLLIFINLNTNHWIPVE